MDVLIALAAAALAGLIVWLWLHARHVPLVERLRAREADAVRLTTELDALRADHARVTAALAQLQADLAAERAGFTAKLEAEQQRLAEQERRAAQYLADVEKLRLECDVFLPAEAARLAAEAEARGRAAPVVESGKAAAEALKVVAQEWQSAGRDGRDLYVLQHLR